MALVTADRVKETTSSTGTGTVTLAGAFSGFQTFSAAVGDGNTTYYAIVLVGGSEWEVGIGTYTASGTTLSRDTVLASSNSGSLVSFSSGSKDVFVVYPSSKAVYKDAADLVTLGNLTLSGTLTLGATALTATAAELNVLDGITSSTAELNILDGVTATASELNALDGITASTAELNILDGVTSTAAELNLVDGSVAGTVVNSKAVVYGASGEVNATTLQIGGTSISATASEINVLDGITASTAELNILDGVTATATELNALDGITATATELNYTDGVTSNIQTQIDAANANSLAFAIALG